MKKLVKKIERFISEKKEVKLTEIDFQRNINTRAQKRSTNIFDYMRKYGQILKPGMIVPMAAFLNVISESPQKFGSYDDAKFETKDIVEILKDKLHHMRIGRDARGLYLSMNGERTYLDESKKLKKIKLENNIKIGNLMLETGDIIFVNLKEYIYPGHEEAFAKEHPQAWADMQNEPMQDEEKFLNKIPVDSGRTTEELPSEAIKKFPAMESIDNSNLVPNEESGEQDENTKYNGWTNYETWNVHLWFSNEEPLYKRMLAGRPYTAKSAEEFAKSIYPEGTPDFDNATDFDLVNWDEIAQAWNEDIVEYDNDFNGLEESENAPISSETDFPNFKKGDQVITTGGAKGIIVEVLPFDTYKVRIGEDLSDPIKFSDYRVSGKNLKLAVDTTFK